MIFKYISKLCLLATFLFITKVCANEYSPDLFINSDNFTFDKIKNLALFEGNVTVHFDNLILKTSLIKIFYKEVNNKKQIENILLPKKLTIIKEEDQTIITANEAIYSPNNNNLLLKGKVIIQYENNIVRTEKFIVVSKLLKINNSGKKIEQNK